MPQPMLDLAARDLKECRALLRGGSKTFLAASLLLPRHVHEPASALYAFCRVADDAIDIEGDSVASLLVRLRLAYDGRPLPFAPDRALADVVARHGIPAALPEALLEGFQWDVEGRRYEDFAALSDYAARVAGTVGAMMALLMGARAPDIVARACDLGVAMQLSNIARDVGEDARNGRLYLPLAWLRDAGIDPDAWLENPDFSPALADVVARLLAEADTLYARAGIGVARLPRTCRPGISAARLMYADIGQEVRRRGFDSISQRAVVSTRRKLWLLMRSLVASLARASATPVPTLESVRFLVEAVVQAPVKVADRETARGKSVDDRIGWLVELFMRLDERQHMET